MTESRVRPTLSQRRDESANPEAGTLGCRSALPGQSLAFPSPAFQTAHGRNSWYTTLVTREPGLSILFLVSVMWITRSPRASIRPCPPSPCTSIDRKPIYQHGGILYVYLKLFVAVKVIGDHYSTTERVELIFPNVARDARYRVA